MARLLDGIDLIVPTFSKMYELEEPEEILQKSTDPTSLRDTNICAQILLNYKHQRPSRHRLCLQKWNCRTHSNFLSGAHIDPCNLFCTSLSFFPNICHAALVSC